MKRRLLIIGGGIQGTMSAAVAARSGQFSEIILCEQALGAVGASQYSAGVHFPYGRQERTRALTRASGGALNKLARSTPSGWHRALAMRVVASDAETLNAEHFTEPLIDEFLPACSISNEFREGTRSWNVSGAHVANVPALIDTLQQGLSTTIRLAQGLKCIAVRGRGDFAEATFATGETISADSIILAPGPWVLESPFRELLEPFSIRIKKVVALHLDRAATEGDPLVFMPGVDAFLLPQPKEGRWLFSYTSTDWDIGPDTLDRGLSRHDLLAGRAVLERFCPTLVQSANSGRVFCDAYSPTGAPIVARLPDHSPIVFVGAANGSGYRFSSQLAEEAVALAAGTAANLQDAKESHA